MEGNKGMVTTSPVLGQVVTEQSHIAWMLDALGLFYGIVIPLTGIVVFIGACVVVTMSRRPAVIAAYLVFVPLPLMVGALATFHNFVSAYYAVSMSTTVPKPGEIYLGTSYFLSAALVGLAATLPAHIVTGVGLFLRTVYARKQDRVR